MKIAATIARYLLGIMFVVFGLNGFLNFIKQPLPTGLAGDYMKIMFTSHYFAAIFAVELLAGLLFLANKFVPLALTLLAGLLFNILAFHITMSPETIAPALLAAILWIILFAQHREAFAGILKA